MTVSYNQDIVNSQTFTFLRVIFRWRGSLWKSVSLEVFIWCLSYYSVMLIYRLFLSNEWQIEFEHIARYTDAKMDYVPLTFMLGFFVSFVVDRWKQIFANIGFVDSFAFFVATYVRGRDQHSRMMRRNLVRYLCLTQVLVLRDISIRVRKRFPTMESLVDAGLLQCHEHVMMEMNQNGFPKYWMPIHWIFTLCQDLHERGRINGGFLDNILAESKKFREQLQALLNYDWVPVPLAYPQVVSLATRLYFLLCLFTRQFRIHEQLDSQVYVEYYVPVMSLLQLVCVMGWLKVAETLLNPMGDDDDDYECNYIIDRNIAVGMTMVDECYGQMPNQLPDTIGAEGQRAMYSETSVNDTQNPLVGSATLVEDFPEEGEHVKMLERKPTIYQIQAERKQSRLSRAFRRTFSMRRGSEPVQPVSSPSMKAMNGFVGDANMAFASSEGAKDVEALKRRRKGFKFSGPSTPTVEICHPSAFPLPGAMRKASGSGEDGTQQQLAAEQSRYLDTVSEEGDSGSVQRSSLDMDSLAMGEAGTELGEFGENDKNGEGKGIGQ